MNIQIFGTSKSFDSKKAERWFKERRIKYQYIDLRTKGLSVGEYRSVKAAVGYDALVDRESKAWKELYMDYRAPADFDKVGKFSSLSFFKNCPRLARIYMT